MTDFESSSHEFCSKPKCPDISSRSTNFTTEQMLNPVPCSLYLWRNPQRDRVTVALEFSSRDVRYFIPNSVKRSAERLVPFGLFKPEARSAFGSDSTLSTPLCFGFDTIHYGTTMHFTEKLGIIFSNNTHTLRLLSL